MFPNPVPSAKVCAVAKNDLAQGELLGKIGEYGYQAVTYRADEARDEKPFPAAYWKMPRLLNPLKKAN
ncbi:MAG: hypothetical protein OXC02_09670 [Rhodobacteraceae bacterium]|nr:hypothetical protein [Paracoccaceae bacterium]